MTTEIVMPRLGDTIETSVVGRWLRGNGDLVKKDEPIAEVESDKTTTELVAGSDGYLCVLVDEGGDAVPGQVVGRIVASREEAERDRDACASERPRPGGFGRRRVTPVARKLAAQAGIDLEEISAGSGPAGRIHRIDVERFIAAEQRDAHEPRTPDTIVDPTRAQRLTASWTTRAKQEIPHYYLSTVADVTEALALKQLASTLEPELRPSLTDVVVFACARSLARHRSVNASWSDGRIIRRGSVNIGIAVALDDDELVVPVIENADKRSLRELAGARRDLVQRARARMLLPREVGCGTFTISNLGNYGVREFHAIINPPESGILAVGEMEEQVVVRGGQPTIRPRLTLSLSADHRVYSGATAAQFLASVRRLLEHPGIALLEPDDEASPTV